MPKQQDELNNDLFQLLKIKGYDPIPFTSDGKQVPTPNEADVFQFRFTKDGQDYGPVTVTVDGSNDLGVYYSDDVAGSPKSNTDDKESNSGDPSWYQLLKQLKVFAKNHQLGFDLKDQDNLKYDMAKREQGKKLDEGYHAVNKKSSYNDSIAEVKMIIKHKRDMQEGEQRYRQIDSIFIENVVGERFLAPTNKPGLARVYARHIAEGGKANDDRWNHINSLCEEYTKMAGFVRATKNGQFNESAQRLVNEGINHYTSLRETLHKLAGTKGYNNYFESYTPQLMEDEVQVDLSEMFMSARLDPRIESVIPILSKLSKNINEGSIAEVKALEEWADSIIEADEGMVSNNPQGMPESEEMEEGYTVTRGIDRDRYQERPGLEGPFSAKNGKVVYYDKVEGKYYDPDTDMYIDHDDWQAMNEATGDKKFDDMMKRVTKKPTQAQRNAERIRQKKEREAETKAYFANGGAFGPSPADKLSIRKQDMAEGYLDDEDDEPPYHTRILDRQTKKIIADDGPYESENEAVDRAEDYLAWAETKNMSIVAQVYQPEYGKNYVTWQVPDEGDYTIKEQNMAEDDSALQAFLSRGGKIQQLPYKKPRKADKTDYGSRHIGGSGDKMKASRTGTAAKTQGSKVVGVAEELDSNQKRVGQLGPTEKVKNNNIGKLVGANESIDQDVVGAKSDDPDYDKALKRFKKGLPPKGKQVAEGQEDLDAILRIIRK